MERIVVWFREGVRGAGTTTPRAASRSSASTAGSTSGRASGRATVGGGTLLARTTRKDSTSRPSFPISSHMQLNCFCTEVKHLFVFAILRRPLRISHHGCLRKARRAQVRVDGSDDRPDQPEAQGAHRRRLEPREVRSDRQVLARSNFGGDVSAVHQSSLVAKRVTK